MKIGCCCNMIATQKDGIGFEHAKNLIELGYDYIELPLAQLMALEDDDFLKIKESLKLFGIKCKTCNNFFPANIKLTGPAVNESVVKDYVVRAVGRASQLGVDTIVFGSSGAKNVPAGFDHKKAWTQLVNLLNYVDTVVRPLGIVIAIEPLNKSESNIINTVKEGCDLAKEADSPNIGLLVDYYHLMVENDDMYSMIPFSDKIFHVHLANPEGRCFPSPTDTANYKEFFSLLNKIGYNRRVSVEAYSNNIGQDATVALNYLREIIA